ncbi:MAG: fumarylacetoacetate hydrolase family protein [Planctomycetes bacterium]|nr:fumarylacetoacetate hydrolase family protein [Planctomycetota bacterium]
MQLCKVQLPSGELRVGVIRDGHVRLLDPRIQMLSEVLHADNPVGLAEEMLDEAPTFSVRDLTLLAPIDHQEVWGAGVTYQRSQIARREESKGAGSFYDKVYTADRPELFFKATPSRVVGPGQRVRLRHDTRWCVPEPELALVVNPHMKIVGYTVGDDISCRDIEGENPLYLPQAKVFDGCCALGPVVTLAGSMPPPEKIGIRMEIHRGDQTAFAGSTSLAKMARPLEDLVTWLAREQRFPHGVILLTGTGIVPPDDFSLQPGDQISITIDGIGTLTSGVERGGS